MGQQETRRDAKTRRGAVTAVLMTIVATVLPGSLLCACHRATQRHADIAAQEEAGPDTADDQTAELSYAPPPQVLDASVRPGGAMVLSGRATPGATLRLSAPEGDVLSAKVRVTGAWTLKVGPISRPRMFALSSSMGDRVVHAEGALLLTPPPSPTALLARAGSGAMTIARSTGAPVISSVDYDAGGFSAVSGLARPREAVRLSLDGAAAGAGDADAAGCYAVLAAGRRLAFGSHVAIIETAEARTQRVFELTPPGPLHTPYQAEAVSGGWRVEWATPGGGVQTTLVFGAH